MCVISNVAYHDYNVVFVYVRLRCVAGHDAGVVSAGIGVIYSISTMDQYNT